MVSIFSYVQLLCSTHIGHVKTATVQMGPLTMNDQAFCQLSCHFFVFRFSSYTSAVHVEDVSTFSSNINSQAYQGLLGLGPNAGSIIRKKMKSGGDAFHQRVFEQDRSTDNYISFLLDRKGDPSDLFKGHFSISEIIPGFENVTSMPKLDVDKVNRILKAGSYKVLSLAPFSWVSRPALASADRRGPRDYRPRRFPSQTEIPCRSGTQRAIRRRVRQRVSMPHDSSVALISVSMNRFTFSQVPREVSDAIYGRVQGAYYDTRKEWWVVPCGQYINISFNFGGVNYPIHPLDAVDDNFGIQDPLGKRACIGSVRLLNI